MTTNVDMPMYSQISATDSHSLVESTVIRLTYPFVHDLAVLVKDRHQQIRALACGAPVDAVDDGVARRCANA